MAYKNKTRFYRIPSMGQGDILTQEQQWIKDSIIDNLLYAATFGCGQCFLQQGKYFIEQDRQNSCCYLVIQPLIQNGFSLMGILNYRMFFSKKPQRIGRLCYNQIYYVYIEFDEQMEYNPQKFVIKYYTKKQESNINRVLICYIQTFENNVMISTDVNKVYAKNILSHTKDTTNPHGQKLIQEDLHVINKLTLNGCEINGTIYDSFITTDNEYYMNIPDDKQILFITAYPQSLQAGNISWKINNNHIIFNNSGKSGIKINIKLDVR